MFIKDLKKVSRNFIIFNRNTGLEYLYSASSKSNQFDHLEILEMYSANGEIIAEVDEKLDVPEWRFKKE